MGLLRPNHSSKYGMAFSCSCLLLPLSTASPCPEQCRTMAPRLNQHMHSLILAKIRRGDSNEKIAEVISSPDRIVTPRPIRRIRSTYARYGVKAEHAILLMSLASISPTLYGEKGGQSQALHPCKKQGFKRRAEYKF